MEVIDLSKFMEETKNAAKDFWDAVRIPKIC